VLQINKESRAKSARHHRVYVQGLSSELHHPDAPKEEPSSHGRGFFLPIRNGAQPVASALDIRTGATLFGRINNTTVPNSLTRSVTFSFDPTTSISVTGSNELTGCGHSQFIPNIQEPFAASPVELSP
jgi:hypothetical protein